MNIADIFTDLLTDIATGTAEAWLLMVSALVVPVTFISAYIAMRRLFSGKGKSMATEADSATPPSAETTTGTETAPSATPPETEPIRHITVEDEDGIVTVLEEDGSVHTLQ